MRHHAASVSLIAAWTASAAGLFTAACLLTAGPSNAANSETRKGIAELNRQHYPRAAQQFFPAAFHGDSNAQAYLGFLYETGRGVPQNFVEAAFWYRRAAEQGHAGAQYQLALLYDAGHGVTKSPIQAYKWIILATSAAAGRIYEQRARIRDAIATKMTRGEIAAARQDALNWLPYRKP